MVWIQGFSSGWKATCVHNKDVTFTVPGNQSMETLLRAVADAVADDE